MRIEEKRRAFLALIPGWYSGYVHFTLINLCGLVLLAFCFSMVRAAPWWQWLFVPAVFIFANCLEWWIHGGWMHHPTPVVMELYLRHAAQHHVIYTDREMAFRESRELWHVLFPPLFFPFLILLTSPVPVTLSLVVSPNLGWLYLFAAVAYYLVYEWFHTVHHWPRETWLGRSAFARLIREHHTRHHEPKRMTGGNYNVSFPLADWMFGTTLPPLPGATREESSTGESVA